MSRNKGQRRSTREKYSEAIEACDSEEYLPLNVSQIAGMYGLTGPALANQLRAHYPDIIPRREAERRKRGMADNIPRGARRIAVETYAEAVEMLRTDDVTVEEAAERCGVSYSGLKQHIIFYHKDLMAGREKRRAQGQATPRTGTVAGNGQIRQPADEMARKYAEAVGLYRATSLPVTEIARMTGVKTNALRNHLSRWHKELMFERRGAVMPPAGSDREPFGAAKRYSRSTAGKYAEAIKELKGEGPTPAHPAREGVTIEGVARKYGLNPDVFRAYLKEHEPQLHESLGMTTLPNGRRVLRGSYEKYRKAIEEYAATGGRLKEIAARHGLTYNSLGNFIRRNLPELSRKGK